MCNLISFAILLLTLFTLVKSFKGVVECSTRSSLRINPVGLETVDTRKDIFHISNFDYTSFPDWRGGGFESIGKTPIAIFLKGNKGSICDADSFLGRLKI
jgi:hypothetical protein